MAISHADHDHPNTPKARAACRKAQIQCTCGGDSSTDGPVLIHSHTCPMKAVTVRASAERKLAEKAKIVKPQAVWAGVAPAKGTKPRAASKQLKKPGTQLRTIGDLPDVPRMLAYGVRLAWANEWPVRVGEQFNDTEARIVIDAPAGEIALVWRPSLPDGVWGVFFRAGYGSVTTRQESVQLAFELGAMTDDM